MAPIKRSGREYKSRSIMVQQKIIYNRDPQPTPPSKMPMGPSVPIRGRTSHLINRQPPAPIIDEAIPPVVPLLKKSLYTSFYTDKNPVRQKELETCMLNNIGNPDISRIYVFIDEPLEKYPILSNDKVVVVHDGNRPTYQMFFDLINRTCGDDDISIISNTDIYFDETIRLLDGVNFTDSCMVLCRWDLLASGELRFYNHRDSQDSWIFKGKVRPMEHAAFNLGKRGCDNRIAHELSKAGYKIFNPSHSIKSIHCHLSNVRNYPGPGIDDVPPPYLTIEPTDIGALPKKEFTILHIGLNVPSLIKSLSKLGRYHFIDWDKYRGNITNLRSKIILASNELNADLVFMQIQCADIIDAHTANNLKGFVVNWTGDVRFPIPKWYYDIGRVIDMTAFSNETDVQTFRNAGIKTDFLQVGFDDVVFNPEGHKNAEAEIVFMGNNYKTTFPLSPLREKMVTFLNQHFQKKFKVYGSGWTQPHTGNLMGKESEEASVYRGCKIAINLSHFDYKRYSSDRIFRIMGSGAFCLTKWYPDIEKDFTDGVHLRVWKDFNELKSIIEYYMTHESERKKIADEGCRFVHENCTWDKRFMELKQLIK